jgi:hypothetical protein
MNASVSADDKTQAGRHGVRGLEAYHGHVVGRKLE